MIKKYSEQINSVKVSIRNDQTINEEILLTPKSNNIGIEILEERIIKFNEGHIKDIMETIKTKYSNTDYFIRKKENELHIVKYNQNLNLNLNEFINGLFKYYTTKPDMKKITEGIKVKGNDNFVIIENLKLQDKFITDLTTLLSKKK